jgi:drug/metabolite transporter (DMT)-like permease
VGALGVLSFATFYKALEIGPISIASPIISAYAAVRIVLAVVVVGETLSGGQTAAVVVVIAGVLLASADLAQLHRIERRQALGLVLALVTAVAIGGFAFGNAYYAAEYGWLLPIFLSRGFATVFLLVAAVSGRSRGSTAARPPGSACWCFWPSGHGRLHRLQPRCRARGHLHRQRRVGPLRRDSFVAGVLLFRERPPPVQWLGATAVIVGVVLLGLTS